jgi:FkbM family methyltransferase
LTPAAYRAAKAANLDLLPWSLRQGLVLDIGANVGAWTDAVLSAAPDVQIIAIEPGDDARRKLEARFAGNQQISIDPRAVSDHKGTSPFYVTEHSHNASLRQPLAETAGLYDVGGWGVSEVVTVETTTVDEITAGRHVAVLKIDVQGAEAAVLSGAAATLERTDAVLLEVTFVPHYEEDASFPRLHELMLERGFLLAGLSRPYMARNIALWSDACYVAARRT